MVCLRPRPPRSRNISASEGASLSTPGPRTSTRSTGRRSSRLRFVTPTYVLDEILEHTTDTAGYTEIVFALFHLLGLQFAPRIRDLGAQRWYRLDAPPRKEGVAVPFRSVFDKAASPLAAPVPLYGQPYLDASASQLDGSPTQSLNYCTSAGRVVTIPPSKPGN